MATTRKPVKKAVKKTTRKTTKKGLGIWQRRLIWGGIAILALLAFLSLTRGKASITEDIALLKGDFTQIWGSNSNFANPIGRFGVLISFPLVYSFGFFFSMMFSLILLGFACMYFFYPRAETLKLRTYLFVLELIIWQTLLVSGGKNGSTAKVPYLLWITLSGIFKPLGAGIILVGAFIFIGIALYGVERLKQNFREWKESTERWQEERENLDKPIKKPDKPTTINQFQEDPVPTPNIIDHQRENQVPKDPDKKPDKKGNQEIFEPIPSPQRKPLAKDANQSPDEEEEDDREYLMPSISDFLESPVKLSDKDRKEIENQILSTSKILRDKLAEFEVEAEVINVNIGPIITQYELKPAAGIKVSKFPSLADDLALAIKAKSIRVQAPIPGRGLIGIEIPNLARDMIYLRDILLSDDMRAQNSKLAFGLGKDISGKPVVTDLTKMPHLLIAGATGSGKSVCINTIIMSLIMRTKPDELRLVLIDPKKVELAGYNDIPHLINSVVTDPDSALETMYWAVKEMERRYELLQEVKVRDILGYNDKAAELKEYDPLPYIVIIIDEFADLIMTSGKDIELPITRLAQMARAVGIHLILATQRPSIKVITGIIKANFPARIAFQVSSRVDSRVILDMIGAERLLGQGDMLFIPPGKAQPERIHGAYVSDHEIARTCDYLQMQPKSKYDFSITTADVGEIDMFDYDDEYFPEAAKLCVNSNMASVSMLQRHFKIGYARAGRLIDMLERARVIGPHLGSKSRDVLATKEDLIHMGVINED